MVLIEHKARFCHAVHCRSVPVLTLEGARKRAAFLACSRKLSHSGDESFDAWLQAVGEK